MSAFDHLFTLWRDPHDGTRHVVGELWREAMGYRFAYVQDLAFATARGFSELSEFPRQATTGGEFRARYLFPTFAQRIPHPQRKDRRALLDAWGVENADDPMEILARSGGVQLTDRIELAEYRGPEDPLTRALEFRVSGERFQPEASGVALTPGERVTLRRDAENPHDPCASVVLVRGDLRLGFVPRQYSTLMAGLIAANVELEGTLVRRLRLPAEAGRWVVRVQRPHP